MGVWAFANNGTKALKSDGVRCIEVSVYHEEHSNLLIMSVPTSVSGQTAMKEGTESAEWGSSILKFSNLAPFLPDENSPYTFEISKPLASLNDKRFNDKFKVSAFKAFSRAVRAISCRCMWDGSKVPIPL